MLIRHQIVTALATCLFILSLRGGLKAQDPKPGQLHEAMTCAGDATQSYAVFLPSIYHKERKWPILYGFSPGANGKHVVELHREAAERFGWIVVASNNSRNGSFDVIDRAAKAIWKDTHEQFSIDDQRLYSAGLSGGGSVAVWFAQNQSTPFAGVFSHARGEIGGVPKKKTETFFMLLPGITSDFNFGESVRFLCHARRTGTRAHLESQIGGHDWAPKKGCHAMLRYADLMARLNPEVVPDRALGKLIDEEAKVLEARLIGPLFLCAWERLEELAGRVHQGHKFKARFTRLERKMKKRLVSERRAWKVLDQDCLFDAKFSDRYPSSASLSAADSARRNLAKDYPGTTATQLAIVSQVLAPRSLSRIDSKAIPQPVREAYLAYAAKVKLMKSDFVALTKKLIKANQLDQAIVALHHGVTLGTITPNTLKKTSLRRLSRKPAFRALKKALNR